LLVSVFFLVIFVNLDCPSFTLFRLLLYFPSPLSRSVREESLLVCKKLGSCLGLGVGFGAAEDDADGGEKSGVDDVVSFVFLPVSMSLRMEENRELDAMALSTTDDAPV